jgi:hypothetical protein
MPTKVSLSAKLGREIASLTRKSKPIDGIRELARREVLRKKATYEIINAQFQKKYGMTFKQFERKCRREKLDETLEKDYFDWDMAVTMLEDIEGELEATR